MKDIRKKIAFDFKVLRECLPAFDDRVKRKMVKKICENTRLSASHLIAELFQEGGESMNPQTNGQTLKEYKYNKRKTRNVS